MFVTPRVYLGVIRETGSPRDRKDSAMGNLREYKEVELNVGYTQFQAHLNDIRNLVDHYEGLVQEWGVEQVVAHFATIGGASGTIGAEFQKAVALASRLVETRFLVEVLQNQEERAEA